MQVTIAGVVRYQGTGRGAGGLLVEVRLESRVIARAAAPTDGNGRFRIQVDTEELVGVVGAASARLGLAVLRANDESDVRLLDSPVLIWPPERDRIALNLVVELPEQVRAEEPISEVSVHLERPVPVALLERLNGSGIRALSDIRVAGGLAHLESLTRPQARAARMLEAQARLAVVIADVETNNRLAAGGVSSVTELAAINPAAFAEETGIELSTVQQLRDRAKVRRWIIDNDLVEALISAARTNRTYGFNATILGKQHWSEVLFPLDSGSDTCQDCASSTSATGPAAYLVDLMDFLIDNFGKVVSTTGSTVQPRGFPDAKAIEARFYRPFSNLIVDHETADRSILQVEIAIEVLDRFVEHVSAKSRKDVYAAFAHQPSSKPRFPKPGVLAKMFDHYLLELGVVRADFDAAIQDAYPASSAQPDKTKLTALLDQLGSTEAALKKGLGLTDATWKPHVEALDWLPELVRSAKTKGIDPDDVAQLGAYHDALTQAEAAVSRVKDHALPDIRANLISYAIYPLTGTKPRNPAITNARQLGDYLHIDLEGDACAQTTRLGSAIEAIQAWVEAFRLGREDAGYYLMFAGGLPEGGFEPRWKWLRSYSTWQAAQSVLLYPENFLLPGVRRDMSAEFRAFLRGGADQEGDDPDHERGIGLDHAGADDQSIQKAVAAYRTAIKKKGGWFADDTLFPDVWKWAASGHGFGQTGFRKGQEEAYALFKPTDLVWKMLDEWYFFLPLAVAEHLNRQGSHERAADWLHNVFYPFTGNHPPDWPYPQTRLVWAGFDRGHDDGFAYRNTVEWLAEPFDPFAVAQVRQDAFLRHVISQYVETLLDWADTEFARDTSESIARARELYELAEAILGSGDLPAEDVCRATWGDLLAQVAATHTPEQTRLVLLLLSSLAALTGRLKHTDLTKAQDVLRTDISFDDRLQGLKQLVEEVNGRAAPKKTVQQLLKEVAECQVPEVVVEDAFNVGASAAIAHDISGTIALSPEVELAARTIRRLGCGFCVPPNPLLTTLRYRVHTNLEKIRTCRNAAGMRRTVQVYAPSADPVAIVQATAAGGQAESAVPSEPPPIHRFSYLIERARYYTDVARQLESQLLNAFEREDAERYSLLKAGQDAQAAQAHLSLQDLRLAEASNGVTLAQLQRDRAVEQKSHFDGLLAQGLIDYEQQVVENQWKAHDWSIAAAAASTTWAAFSAGTQFAFLGGGAAAVAALAAAAPAAQGVSSAASLYAQARSTQAAFERRREEWQFQSTLAEWDRRIGEQSIALANDRVNITGQEREIARLQGRFAGEVVEFLGSKFTSLDLWQWMGKVLRGQYRDHLAMATVTARMAQRALEFERQESIPIIAGHYGEHEKRDLLAAEHLLSDINKLDQYRLTTERRRKEVTKTFSLAELDPVGFNALRQGHGMTFTTMLSHFDADFPGHYLRLINSVSLTVLALVPPHQAIHATLSNAGVSRVIAGPPFDKPRLIQRQPESIAVTTASNGTGLFEMRFDDPILLPFESIGVATSWMLDLPQGANRFDFETLTDVLFTMRYTALEDSGYREKNLRQQGMSNDRRLSAGGSTFFPLRTTVPDEWFDLYHPHFIQDAEAYGFGSGGVKPPYSMQLQLASGDFPPHESNHALTRITVAIRQSSSFAVPIEVLFNPVGVSDEYAASADHNWDPGDRSTGPVSVATFTRHRANPEAPWQSVTTPMAKLPPFGNWRLRLRNEDANPTLIDGQENAQNILKLDWLEDILLVVIYNATVEYRYIS